MPMTLDEFMKMHGPVKEPKKLSPDNERLKALILQYFPINRQCKFEEMKLAVRREQLLEALVQYLNTLS